MAESKEKSRTLAILMNALVIPGAGHYYLGKRIKGVILACISLLLIIITFSRFAVLLFYHMNIAQTYETDIFRLTWNAIVAVWPAFKGTFFTALVAILVLWAYGILDLSLKGSRSKV